MLCVYVPVSKYLKLLMYIMLARVCAFYCTHGISVCMYVCLLYKVYCTDTMSRVSVI